MMQAWPQIRTAGQALPFSTQKRSKPGAKLHGTAIPGVNKTLPANFFGLILGLQSRF
jgi:hypothetical protein